MKDMNLEILVNGKKVNVDSNMLFQVLKTENPIDGLNTLLQKIEVETKKPRVNLQPKGVPQAPPNPPKSTRVELLESTLLDVADIATTYAIKAKDDKGLRTINQAVRKALGSN